MAGQHTGATHFSCHENKALVRLFFHTEKKREEENSHHKTATLSPWLTRESIVPRVSYSLQGLGDGREQKDFKTESTKYKMKQLPSKDKKQSLSR